MSNIIKALVFAFVVLYLSGCATISGYQGQDLKPNEAIVIMGVQPGDFLFTRSEGYSHQLFANDDSPLVLTVKAGEFEIHYVSHGMFGFNPELKIIEIAPGSVNYVGNIQTMYDTAYRQAALMVVDEEQKTVDVIRKSHPEIFTKYKYQKRLLESKISGYGTPKDYLNFPIPQPSESDAMLVIYRPSDGSSGEWVTAGIRIDETRIVGLEIDDYTYLRVTPGDYRLIAEMGVFQGETAQNTVSLSAGGAYFFRLSGGSVFKRIPIPVAVEELKGMDYDPVENPPALK